MDYGRAEKTGSYFNTGYYAPIRLDYERGASHVALAIGAAKPKVFRAAQLAPLYGFFAGRDRGLLTREDRQRVQQSVYQRLERDTGGPLQLPPVDSVNADILADQQDEDSLPRIVSPNFQQRMKVSTKPHRVDRQTRSTPGRTTY
jgi:hypothetical protein